MSLTLLKLFRVNFRSNMFLESVEPTDDFICRDSMRADGRLIIPLLPLPATAPFADGITFVGHSLFCGASGVLGKGNAFC